MFGLVVIVFFVFYLVVSIGIIILVVRWAKKRGRRAWLWGGLVAFLMYNLVFWDYLPTVAVREYYCSTQAGFWVYESADEWKAENPGVLEKPNLVNNTDLHPSKHEGDMNNFTSTEYVTNQLKYVFRHNGPFFLHRWRLEASLVDINSNQVLAKYVDFSTSQERRKAGWSGWKFWLDTERCSSMSHKDNGNIKEMIEELGGEK